MSPDTGTANTRRDFGRARGRNGGRHRVENVTNGICLNFHGAPVNSVLEYLSDAGGFVINLETEVRGTMDVWSNGPVTKGQAIELLNSGLKQHGYTVTRQGRILTVVNLDRAKTATWKLSPATTPMRSGNRMRWSRRSSPSVTPMPASW